MEVTEETREILIAVAAILQQRRAIRASSISGRMDGAAAFDAGTPAEWVVMLGQDAHPRRVARTQVAQDGDAWHVSGGSRDVEIEIAGRLHDLMLPYVVDVRAVTVQAAPRGPAQRLGYSGADTDALALRPPAAAPAIRM